MKIVHISDTHLGFKAYSYADKDTDLNQRELDNYQCFKEAIDKILEIKPLLVLHSGDLFDSTRPSNYSLDFTIEQFKRLTAENIKVVLLAGNHSTPKIKNQGHIFRIFRHFTNIIPLYKGQYEYVEIDNICIHAVSQSISEEAFQQEISNLNNLNLQKYKLNVLMLHGAFSSIKEFSMNEFNELTIPPTILKKNFDYIALGHYHNQVSITKNCYYAGSLVPLTFNEVQDKKGFLLMDLETKEIKTVNISSRPLIDLDPIDANNLTAENLEKKLENNLNKLNKGCICRQKVSNLNEDTISEFDAQSIKKKANNCLHYQLELNRKEQTDEGSLSETIGNLSEEFIHFLKHKNIKKDQDAFRKMGLDYLSKTYEID